MKHLLHSALRPGVRVALLELRVALFELRLLRAVLDLRLAPTCAPQTCMYLPTTYYRTYYRPLAVTAYSPVTSCGACGCPCTTCYYPTTAWTYQPCLVPYTSYRVVYSNPCSACGCGCGSCCGGCGCGSCFGGCGSCGSGCGSCVSGCGSCGSAEPGAGRMSVLRRPGARGVYGAGHCEPGPAPDGGVTVGPPVIAPAPAVRVPVGPSPSDVAPGQYPSPGRCAAEGAGRHDHADSGQGPAAAGDVPEARFLAAAGARTGGAGQRRPGPSCPAAGGHSHDRDAGVSKRLFPIDLRAVEGDGGP